MTKITTVLALLAAFLCSAQINNYVKDTSFNPFVLPNGHYYIDGYEITDAIVQPDGKIASVVTSYSSVPTSKIVRTSNNLLDTGFTTGIFNNIIKDIILQPDGKFVVVGAFTTYEGLPAKYIVRLNSDGTRDTTFEMGTGFTMQMFSGTPWGAVVKLLPDGKLLVGGDIATYNGIAKPYLVRLNSNGVLDESFSLGSGWNTNVTNITVQPDGKILIAYGGALRRVNADGTPDLTFSIYNNNSSDQSNAFTNTTSSTGDNIKTMVVQPDGKILVGGNWEYALGTTRHDFVRLNSNGTLDNEFDFHAFDAINGDRDGVRAIFIMEDGKILLGGDFDRFNNSESYSLIRINNDGTLDTSFSAMLGFEPAETRNNTVRNLSRHTDGTILCTGRFFVYNGDFVNHIVKIYDNGTRDTTFNNIGKGFNGVPQRILVYPDGKILVAGDFHAYNGITRYRILRLHADGSLDESFEANTADYMYSYTTPFDIALQPDNKILIASPGKHWNGEGGGALVRINSDGSIDDTFFSITGSGSYGIYGTVYTVKVLPDGKILAGGDLFMLNGELIQNLVRFNNDGTLDDTFNFEDPYAIVKQVERLPDGKILMSASLSGTTYRLYRLNENGDLDTTFTTESTIVPVSRFDVLPDGKIIITNDAGNSHKVRRLNSDGTLDTTYNTFTSTFNQSSLNDNARQADGKLLLAVRTAIDPRAIIRLNENGTTDTTFNINGTGFGYGIGSILNTFSDRVSALTFQSDGRLLAGGSFRMYNDAVEYGIVRLQDAFTQYIENIVVQSTSESCEATVNYTTPIGPSGSTVVQIAGLPSGSIFPAGVTTNTFQITNGANLTTASFTVTVIDNIVPSVITQPFTIELDADGMAVITAEQIDNGSTDNCGIASYQLSKSEFSCVDLGANEVTLIVTDNAGNSASATTTITITESTLPTVITHPLTIELDADGMAAITVEQIDNGSTDNCGIASYQLSKSEFGCGDLGANEVILTVTDNAGNSASATTTITITESTLPTVITQPLTIELDADGMAAITVEQIDNGSTDNCGIASYQLSKSEFGCGDLGANEVILTVTDNAGNSASATTTITITESTLPTVITQPLTLELDADGMAAITAEQVDNGSTDNCGIASYQLSKSEFSCNDLGANEVILTVTDNAGNSALATATVNVADSTAPVVISQSITVALNSEGNAVISAQELDAGSSDNCGIVSFEINKNNFNCDDLGNNEVLLTVSDSSGNTVSAIALVIVTDPLESCATSGRDENQVNPFMVYPNPVDNILNISGTTLLTNVQVYNILGQIILSQDVNSTDCRIDMSSISSGKYFVKITTNETYGIAKIIKL